MSLIDELRSAVRSLLRQPGVVALAVGVLALGLGVNVAVLAVAHGVLWKPLPYPEAHRLMTVAEVYEEGGPEHGARLGQLREWNLRLRTARVAGYAVRERAVRGAGQSRVLEVATVTDGFFDVVGVPARLGDVPGFAPGDAGVVISATLARMLDTGADGPAVGQGVTIGDRRYDVAAVMPAEFAFPSEDTHVWLAPPGVAAEGSGSYRLVGRMRSGTNVARVREDATRVARELNGEDWSAAVRPVEETLRGELSRPVLLASIVAALLVLAVACANAVTLLIGRSLVRRREFVVRIALGCSRARVIRTALVEGLVVAAAGFVLGLALARAGLRAFSALAAGVLPRADAVAVDPPVLLAGGVLTLLAAGACGAASAAGAVGRGGSALLRGTAATGSRTTRTPRTWLAAGQIALSIVLLAGAGLLARTVERLLNEESGFEPQRALTARLMLADTPFVEGGAATAFVNALLERIRALPGVRAAGVGSMLPPRRCAPANQFRLPGERHGFACRLHHPVVRRGHGRLLRGPGHSAAARAPVRGLRPPCDGVPGDPERDRGAVHPPSVRRPGRPADAVGSRALRDPARGFAGGRRRGRREVPGARRAAGGLGVRSVAARAHRRVAPRDTDHRRSAGAGADDPRPRPDPGPVAAGAGGAHARGSRRRLGFRPEADRRARGRLRGACAGGRHGRVVRGRWRGPSSSGGGNWPSAPRWARHPGGCCGTSCATVWPLRASVWQRGCRERRPPAGVSAPCFTASVRTTR